MIYCNDLIGLLPVVCFNTLFDAYLADYSYDNTFEFKDGKTVYFKNRNNDNYQYTEEEIILIKLTYKVCDP